MGGDASPRVGGKFDFLVFVCGKVRLGVHGGWGAARRGGDKDCDKDCE